VEICVKVSLISVLSLFFLIFIHDFIIYIDFTIIVASNTASDDVIIRSHVEYLIQTYILVCSVYSQNW